MTLMSFVVRQVCSRCGLEREMLGVASIPRTSYSEANRPMRMPSRRARIRGKARLAAPIAKARKDPPNNKRSRELLLRKRVSVYYELRCASGTPASHSARKGQAHGPPRASPSGELCWVGLFVGRAAAPRTPSGTFPSWTRRVWAFCSYLFPRSSHPPSRAGGGPRASEDYGQQPDARSFFSGAGKLIVPRGVEDYI